MAERDSNRPKTTEEWVDHISEFTQKREVGSPEHLAINDFLNLQNLYEGFGKEPDYFLAAVSGEANLSQEQRASRDLQRIALLENTIEQNQASLPGYAKAYIHLDV